MTRDAQKIRRAVLAFGAVMVGLGIAQGFRVGFSLRLILTVVAASAGGSLVVAGALTWISRRGAGRLAREGFSVTNTDPIQERLVDVELNAAAAFAASLAALRVIPKIRIVREDRDAGAIDARTRMTWRSFGELVTVRVTRIGDDYARIGIRSEPTGRQQVDYGKSVENVELFLKQIGQRPTAKS
jgi:hypothetical protein